ncbi:lipase family protein [Gordonia soli]|uniref:Putative lipase n=1 Tax=Gordonia soli NBRC 108243 TaxID=1223545 RepID=M0QK88_9ACTN|nr:lipase family protein [Gordonia soli]GAC69050.1 putative lipase [Gordonia soli NBRC 108243]
MNLSTVRSTTGVRRPWRRAVVGTAIVSLVAGLISAAAGTASADNVSLPTPLRDRFYDAPRNLDKLENGDIIRARNKPNPPAFVGVRTYQVAFRSTDSQDKPIVGVTTLLVPTTKKPNGPLLSFEHIVNATGLQCAPSQALWTEDPNLAIREAPALNVVLQQGWTIAIPDHLGPRSAYGAAKLGGKVTLDGIRAAQKFAPAGVRKSKVGLAGYSGGGMAAAWAAALAPKYAPDVNLVGAAYGGAPMNLIKMAEGLGYNNPHPAFGLAFAAAIGFSREYPKEIPIQKYLSGLGRQMYRELRNACTNDILRVGAGHSAKQVALGGEQIFENKEARRVVSENSLSLYPGIPRVPIFEWHSPTDVLIPVSSITYTINRYCRAGARVQTLLTPSPDHLSAATIGVLPALNFLTDRFEGRPAPSNC